MHELTFEVGEHFQIGDGIVVRVIATQGSQTKLGIEAPRDVAVHREEIYERICKERQRSTTC
ncbi:carbon storage regulator CsrA [Pseudomonas sp. No.21]|uniref:carbon storage regulator n=1 Tax=Pseudomonas TaxID=286 RepID=UPI000DA85F72|nr:MULTISPECIES: carbon storage regulator [Pseudomonas]MDW3716335.1 carbon storage regulator [Pseudomonas sp. 2023EL-01195]PZE09244.1 carbon storage regulator [Pseudomonas sp. 57B-090624]